MGASVPPTRHELVVATDRLPIERIAGAPGQFRWRERADGLVGALRSVVAARRGAWIGSAEPDDMAYEPFAHDELWVHPLPLSRPEIDEYRDGYCATTLSPLYLDCMQPIAFHRRWGEAYQNVNRRFADRIAEIAAPGGVVWIHDHHLQLVPGHLRRMRPDLLIGFFMHSPFPPAELFLRLPMREQIMRGLLGADLVGFQHTRAAANFVEMAGELLALPVGDNAIDIGDRRIGVGVFPMSIDAAEVDRLACDPKVRAAAAAIRAELDGPRTVLLTITKPAQPDGTAQLLDAYRELLADRSIDPQQTVLVLVAAPDPYAMDKRRQDSVTDRRVAEINELCRGTGRPAVHYVRRELSRCDLVALYVAADVMLATPLRAGAALPAKEYLAARTDDSGYLVLSEFTATAAELPQAHTVNPHDTEALKAAVSAAVSAVGDRRTRAMAEMREQVRATDANGWAGRFLSGLGDCVAAAYLPASGPVVVSESAQPPGRNAADRCYSVPHCVPVPYVAPAPSGASIRAGFTPRRPTPPTCR